MSEDIIREAERNNMPIPAEIESAPELAPGLELYLEAFWQLSSCRQVGMGEGPIPWTAIEEWARSHDFRGDQKADLHHHVRSMDVAYLEHQAKKAEDERRRGGRGKS